MLSYSDQLELVSKVLVRMRYMLMFCMSLCYITGWVAILDGGCNGLQCLGGCLSHALLGAQAVRGDVMEVVAGPLPTSAAPTAPRSPAQRSAPAAD